MSKVLWRVLGAAYFTVFMGGFFIIPAYAYIDPTTTAMVTQVVAGIFISLGVAFGVFRKKIMIFFKNLHVKRMQKKISKDKK